MNKALLWIKLLINLNYRDVHLRNMIFKNVRKLALFCDKSSIPLNYIKSWLGSGKNISTLTYTLSPILRHNLIVHTFQVLCTIKTV